MSRKSSETFTSQISRVAPGVFQVQGKSGVYLVRRSPRSCSCPGFTYRKACRHLDEVRTFALANPATSEQERFLSHFGIGVAA
jgi:hypothetical protein